MAGARSDEYDGHHGGGHTAGLFLVDEDDGVVVPVDVASFHVEAGVRSDT
jgi:hypothetical protein